MLQTLWRRLFAPKKCGCCAGEKTLNDVGTGQSVRIECLRGEEGVCQRLRELGFCESAVIEKVADNGGLICRVCDARIAISKGLAGNIIVKDLCFHPSSDDGLEKMDENPSPQGSLLGQRLDSSRGMRSIPGTNPLKSENDFKGRSESAGGHPEVAHAGKP